MKILLINGPNLNLLGIREPSLYGRVSLPEIERVPRRRPARSAWSPRSFSRTTKARSSRGSMLHGRHRSGHPHQPGRLHPHLGCDPRRPAGWISLVEIHISNVSAREPFRQKNLFSDIAAGTISGFGPYGYILGIEALHELLRGKNR